VPKTSKEICPVGAKSREITPIVVELELSLTVVKLIVGVPIPIRFIILEGETPMFPLNAIDGAL